MQTMPVELGLISSVSSDGFNVSTDEFAIAIDDVVGDFIDYGKLSDKEQSDYEKARKCAKLLKDRNPDLLDSQSRLTYELLKRVGMTKARSYYVIFTKEGHGPFEF